MKSDGSGPREAAPILLILCFTYLVPQIVSASLKGDLGDLESFKITWEGAWLPSLDNIDEEHVVQLSTTSNQLYKCIIPGVSDQLSFDTSATNSSSDLNTKSPIKVLEPLLSKNYCSYKFEPFWVYELCHGKFLRQYHEERVLHSKVTQQYHLGRMTEDQLGHQKLQQEVEWILTGGHNQPTIEVNGQHRPYVTFNMTDGTECDITHKSRTAKIIYVCNDEHNHELYSVKETSTCEYEAIVLSPLLCHLKHFKADTTDQEIKCYSLAGAPRKPDKVLDVEADAKNGGQPGASGRRGPAAYMQGRTLIIDADLLFS